MLEKFLKMLFSFSIKKNISTLLIILVLLILALLFFGNFNLIEGNIVENPRKGERTPLIGADKIQNFTEKMIQAQNY